MKYNRQRELEEYVSKHGFVSLDTLCQVFNKSKNTIRRDVSELSKMGAIQKVYGGVCANKQFSLSMLPFSERNIKRMEEKKTIATLAAALVSDDDVIYIDSGTTTMHLLPSIAAKKGVTVISNNFQVLAGCLEYPSINAISFGGQLNPETSSFQANFCNLDYIRNFSINKAFMSATGVSISKGVTNSSPGELPIKRCIVEISDQNILLVDNEKFEHAALLSYAELQAFQTVITNKKTPESYLHFFSQNCIKLIYPQVI